MKKAKILTIVLVVSVMLLGAGYAYWTQELNINTTVSTGDLNVEFVPLETFADDYFDRPDYMNVSIKPNDEDTIGFNINNIYPGAGGFIGFAIVNKGTVPAKLSDIILANMDGINATQEDLFAYISSPIVKFTKGSVTDIEINGPLADYIEGVLNDVVEGIEIPYNLEDFGDFELAYSLNDFRDDLKAKFDDVTLEPGEFIVVNGTESFWFWRWDWEVDYEEFDYLETGYSIYMPTTVEEYEGQPNIKFDLVLQYQQQE